MSKVFKNNKQDKKDKKKIEKIVKLSNCHLWNKKRTKFIQPPVPIKFGDFVDIEYTTPSQTVLGRYIGKGMGAAICHSEVFIGYVVSRGIDNNPRQLSDEELMKLYED